jgi:hypothetical protein
LWLGSEHGSRRRLGRLGRMIDRPRHRNIRIRCWHGFGIGAGAGPVASSDLAADLSKVQADQLRLFPNISSMIRIIPLCNYRTSSFQAEEATGAHA